MYPSRPRTIRTQRLDAIPSYRKLRITYGSAVTVRLRARRKRILGETAAGAAQVCTIPDIFFEKAACHYVLDMPIRPRSACWSVSETAVAQLAWLGGLCGDMETRGRDGREDSSRTALDAPA